jgi:hypothetical protein
MVGSLIPIFGIVFGCGIALLAIWTEYKRDKALIEKGLYQPEKEESSGPPGHGFLVIGSVLVGTGAALVVSTFIFQVGRATGIPGFVLLFIGIALIIVYFVVKGEKIIPKD